MRYLIIHKLTQKEQSVFPEKGNSVKICELTGSWSQVQAEKNGPKMRKKLRGMGFTPTTIAKRIFEPGEIKRPRGKKTQTRAHIERMAQREQLNQKVIARTTCPRAKCAAQKGSPCRNTQGKIRKNPHASRANLLSTTGKSLASDLVIADAATADLTRANNNLTLQVENLSLEVKSLKSQIANLKSQISDSSSQPSSI